MSEWLFMSIDKEGKVVINSVTKVMFIYKASKFIVIEPSKNEPKFLSLECRFKSSLHPQIKLNDLVTLVAVGNQEKVLILAITAGKSQLMKEIHRPKYKSTALELKDFTASNPSICWGYGHSPVCKDKCYATLAIAWGPLVQLYVLNNVMEEKQQIFIEDGFHVLEPLSPEDQGPTRTNSMAFSNENQRRSSMLKDINPYEQENRFQALRSSIKHSEGFINQSLTPFEMDELFIERIFYLSDSVIMVLTRSLELRILYTQKMNYGVYNPKTFAIEAYNKKLEEEQKTETESKISGCQVDCGISVTNLAES